ncbi:MAG: response regulator transcription factor [Ruminiclostridium sp.]|nr:response regulator transcription factor [Ruminiclostridium sp.]MBQ8826311.1 response regulator transcription factor [Oscillospiraceae bacterium]
MNNNKYRILVIEDEDNIKTFVSALLEANNYQVITAESCNSGLMMFNSHRPDLVILDLGLPDLDGTEFLKAIRKTSSVPVIVLSARTDESDKVSALDMGANDYVTKPFGSAELVARIRTALRSTRQGGGAGTQKFELDKLVIDYDSRRIYLDGEEIKLTQTEYNIVALLSEHCGKVMTYSAIVSAIWGYNDYGSKKKLQVNMANIRKKFGAAPGKDCYIINELGVGYRMDEIN